MYQVRGIAKVGTETLNETSVQQLMPKPYKDFGKNILLVFIPNCPPFPFSQQRSHSFI